MKKIALESYQKPLMKLIEIKPAEIIAASLEIAPSTDPFDEEEW